MSTEFNPYIQECFSLGPMSLIEMFERYETDRNCPSIYKPGSHNFVKQKILYGTMYKYEIHGVAKNISPSFFRTLEMEGISGFEVNELKTEIEKQIHSKTQEQLECGLCGMEIQRGKMQLHLQNVHESTSGLDSEGMKDKIKTEADDSIESLDMTDIMPIDLLNDRHILSEESQENEDCINIFDKDKGLQHMNYQADRNENQAERNENKNSKNYVSDFAHYVEIKVEKDPDDLNYSDAYGSDEANTVKIERDIVSLSKDKISEEPNPAIAQAIVDQSDISYIKCYLCSERYMYSDVEKLWSHIQDSHMSKQHKQSARPRGKDYYCSHCIDSTFHTFRELKHHEECVHVTGSACFICGLSMNKSADVLIHLENYHTKSYQCICGTEFTSSHLYSNHTLKKNHMAFDPEERIVYSCLLCGDKFQDVKLYRRHNQRCKYKWSAKTNQQCFSCKRNFLDEIALIFHQDVHANMVKYAPKRPYLSFEIVAKPWDMHRYLEVKQRILSARDSFSATVASLPHRLGKVVLEKVLKEISYHNPEYLEDAEKSNEILRRILLLCMKIPDFKKLIACKGFTNQNNTERKEKFVSFRLAEQIVEEVVSKVYESEIKTMLDTESPLRVGESCSIRKKRDSSSELGKLPVSLTTEDQLDNCRHSLSEVLKSKLRKVIQKSTHDLQNPPKAANALTDPLAGNTIIINNQHGGTNSIVLGGPINQIFLSSNETIHSLTKPQHNENSFNQLSSDPCVTSVQSVGSVRQSNQAVSISPMVVGNQANNPIVLTTPPSLPMIQPVVASSMTNLPVTAITAATPSLASISTQGIATPVLNLPGSGITIPLANLPVQQGTSQNSTSLLSSKLQSPIIPGIAGSQNVMINPLCLNPGGVPFFLPQVLPKGYQQVTIAENATIQTSTLNCQASGSASQVSLSASSTTAPIISTVNVSSVMSSSTVTSSHVASESRPSLTDTKPAEPWKMPNKSTRGKNKMPTKIVSIQPKKEVSAPFFVYAEKTLEGTIKLVPVQVFQDQSGKNKPVELNENLSMLQPLRKKSEEPLIKTSKRRGRPRKRSGDHFEPNAKQQKLMPEIEAGDFKRNLRQRKLKPIYAVDSLHSSSESDDDDVKVVEENKAEDLIADKTDNEWRPETEVCESSDEDSDKSNDDKPMTENDSAKTEEDIQPRPTKDLLNQYVKRRMKEPRQTKDLLNQYVKRRMEENTKQDELFQEKWGSRNKEEVDAIDWVVISAEQLMALSEKEQTKNNSEETLKGADIANCSNMQFVSKPEKTTEKEENTTVDRKQLDHERVVSLKHDVRAVRNEEKDTLSRPIVSKPDLASETDKEDEDLSQKLWSSFKLKRCVIKLSRNEIAEKLVHQLKLKAWREKTASKDKEKCSNTGVVTTVKNSLAGETFVDIEKCIDKRTTASAFGNKLETDPSYFKQSVSEESQKNKNETNKATANNHSGADDGDTKVTTMSVRGLDYHENNSSSIKSPSTSSLYEPFNSISSTSSKPQTKQSSCKQQERSSMSELATREKSDVDGSVVIENSRKEKTDFQDVQLVKCEKNAVAETNVQIDKISVLKPKVEQLQCKSSKHLNMLKTLTKSICSGEHNIPNCPCLEKPKPSCNEENASIVFQQIKPKNDILEPKLQIKVEHPQLQHSNQQHQLHQQQLIQQMNQLQQLNQPQLLIQPQQQQLNAQQQLNQPQLLIQPQQQLNTQQQLNQPQQLIQPQLIQQQQQLNTQQQLNQPQQLIQPQLIQQQLNTQQQLNQQLQLIQPQLLQQQQLNTQQQLIQPQLIQQQLQQSQMNNSGTLSQVVSTCLSQSQNQTTGSVSLGRDSSQSQIFGLSQNVTTPTSSFILPSANFSNGIVHSGMMQPQAQTIPLTVPVILQQPQMQLPTAQGNMTNYVLVPVNQLQQGIPSTSLPLAGQGVQLGSQK